MNARENIAVSLERGFRLPPSILSKKMICPAYITSPMRNEDRLRFLGFHAMTVQKVIARHLEMGCILEGIESKANRGRVDLIFRHANGKKRQVEVKSGKKIYLYAQYQAALYWNGRDELVVSNPIEYMLLSQEFIEKAINLAQETETFLTNYPEKATELFKPSSDLCRICGNNKCSLKTNCGEWHG